MRFLVDESVGGAVTQYLRDAGHDVLAVAELAPRAEDSGILAWATHEQRMVITNDKDFGELVYRSGQAHDGILLLRLRDESATNQGLVLTAVLDQYADRLSGRFVVVSESKVRIRRQITQTEDEDNDKQ